MPRMLLMATVAVLAIGLVVVAAGSAGDRPDARTAAVETAPDVAPKTPTDGPFALAAQRPTSPTEPPAPDPYDRPRRTTHEGGSAALPARMRAAERQHAYRAYFFDDLARRLDVTNIEIRRAVRDALASLRRDPSPVDLRSATADELATLKRRLAARVGARLRIPAPRVVAAVRAEMIDTLRWAVDGGTISKEARARAVDCFDDPTACDVDALRASLPSGRRGR